MTISGVYKQCGCRDAVTGRRVGAGCGRLGERGHGSWYFRCQVKDLWGRSEQVRRGGFTSRAAACRARADVLEQSREQLAGRSWTVGRWLRYWLTTRTSIRPTTLRVYTHHVETHLIPAIGEVKLAALTSRHLTAMFAELAAGTTPIGQPRTAATLQRIRATLRAAYNAAIREGMVMDNPARRVEMPRGRRPHAVVWTDARVDQWHEDGSRPPVAVWTTAQLTTFLDFVADDPLYPLWWLVALRGLRRGEVAGLRWQDVDLDRRQLTIVSQRTTVGYAVIECPPKSSASHRTIALDRRTVDLLRAHRHRQHQQYLGTGRLWRETGYVFTRPDGQPYHPNYFTHRLQYLIKQCGLPPVRLHDLRHGAASLAHAAGADLKTIQDQLGHASVVLTADTYTTVLPAAQHKAAEATARLILTTARGARAKIRRKSRRPTPQRPPQKSTTAPPASTPAPPRRPAQSVGKSKPTRSTPKRR
jgi:integrase